MRARVRPALRGLSTVLIVAGALLLADAVTTLVWQEPVSALMAARNQGELNGDLRALERQAPSTLERRALAVLDGSDQRLAFLARAQRRKAKTGAAIGRIRIPSIGVDKVIVNGTDTASLKKGPGLYPETPYPGVPGTTAIAGHRTTYGAPFRNINRIGKGDELIVDMPYGRFTYRFEKQQIVLPTAVEVIRPVGYKRLVLSACEPLYSAAKRIIVFARLVRAEPRGPALENRT